MKLIIHGGFFSESHTHDKTKSQKQAALKRIVHQGFQYLKNHTSIQTVAYVVQLLEDDPLFNAGTGSQIQADGRIRMSAALMDGSSLKMAGVVNIEHVKNPILVAEKLMSYEDKILGGTGAIEFARTHHFPFFDPQTKERKEEYDKKKDNKNHATTRTSTVGCVCIDKLGKLATATSTGGKGYERPGRISDSATVAGNYANAHCGVSLTGIGEDIVSLAMAAKIATRVSDGMTLAHAFEKSFLELKQIDGLAGAIGIDDKGNIQHQESHPTMVYASYDGILLDIF
ncbi:isoaspartyl peptidase/L-asparaginase [Myroides fluvii]|uniref:isoaspartyl peptidase/L-asparaginase n=1 Tax=Myroides fluvii TaxID=2572594 RepID=UPI00131DA5E4|nr:isoaspartyl peptidase/L-asparaginase [Myroides fluvii]